MPETNSNPTENPKRQAKRIKLNNKMKFIQKPSLQRRRSLEDISDQMWPPGFEFPSSVLEETVEHWVSEVLRFSSQFGSGPPGSAWTAANVIGPPRVTQYGDNGNAWAVSTIGNTNDDWLELKIARAIKIRQINLHESLCGGAFKALKLWNGTEFITLVEQEARCGQYPQEIRIEEIRVLTGVDWATDTFRLEFNVAGGNTWYEIDAIEVIGNVPKASSVRQQRQLNQADHPLVSHVGGLLLDASTSDCTLVLDGTNKEETHIPVHRGILAARCPYFRTLIDNQGLPMGGEQPMPGIPRSLMDQVLEWIYTGRLVKHSPGVEDCLALATAADFYQIDDLTKYCVEIFEEDVLRVETAAQLYVHFEAHCIIPPLVDSVREFMAQNFVAVSQTAAFASLSQSQLLELIACYGKYQAEDQ